MTTTSLVNGHARSDDAPAARPPRDIPIRRPTFAFDTVRERHWFGGDAFQTHLLYAFSLTFPEGERFFMDAVRHFASRVKSPALRQDITRFLGQEAMHGRAHTAFNQWIAAQGFDTEALERDIREDLARARREHKPIEWLAVTCALEHFTAILAERLFVDDELCAEMAPEMRELWLWHAVEETEHKAVAFDTFLEVGGTYRMRVVAMLIATLGFWYRVSRYQAQLMREDPEAPKRFGMLHGWVRMWLWPGKLAPVIPAYLDYYRPGFHPWQREPRGSYERCRAAMNAAQKATAEDA